MEDWVWFFNSLGRFLSRHTPPSNQRVNAILTAPMLEYASLVIASGAVCERFEDRTNPSDQLERWIGKEGQSVVFPLPKRYRDDGGVDREALVRKEGVVDSVDCRPGTDDLILRVRYLEQHGGNIERNYTSFVRSEFLPLVSEIETAARIDTMMRGSRIAEDLEGLSLLFGLKGAIEMIANRHKVCCIFDSKARVHREASEDLPIARLSANAVDGVVLMRDAVRFRGDGREAVRDTSSCKVLKEAEEDWPIAIISGSNRMLSFWEECESQVRVGIISSVESSYGDAVEYANLQFRRRSPGPELVPPPEVMRCMPSTVDVQFFYSSC